MGLSSKINGQIFESYLKQAASRVKFSCVKIPDGCRRIRKKIVPVKSPFDFILTSANKVYFIDAKSTIKETFHYSDINQSQLHHLKLLKNSCSFSGYVINLNGEVSFFDIDVLLRCRPNSGLSKEHGIYLGTRKNFDLTKII